MSFPYTDFISSLEKRFPNQVGLCEPNLKGNEIKYLTDCINTGWVSTAGKYVTAFENKIKEISGAQFAIATSTGTSALHTLYLSAGIEPGNEVLTQSFTFIATVNAISYCNATPHFIDIANDSTLTIDPEKLKKYLTKICTLKDGQCINKNTGSPIKALVVMHTFGKSSRLDELKDLCDEYNIILLEDAAEAMGTKYKNKHVGSFGLGGVFSFNGNKITTCGAGGVIVTNNKDIADTARHISTTAKEPHPYLYNHDQIGFNYRMANINAAVGLAQLEQLSEILSKKRNLFNSYKELFADIENIELLKDESWSTANHWLNAVELKDCNHEQLLKTLEQLNQKSISVRPAWTPIHKLEPYSHCPADDLGVTNMKANSIINLPSSSFL